MKIIKRDNNANNAVYTPIRSIWDDFFTVPSLLDEPYFNSPMREISADIWQEDDNIFVKMAVPGIKEEDLNITVENDFLKISATRKEEEKKDTDKKYLYRSMSSSFEQTFNLPNQVDTDAAEAKLEDGVVTIKLPKSEEQKAKQIKFSK
jgi:HSP20 family protein